MMSDRISVDLLLFEHIRDSKFTVARCVVVRKVVHEKTEFVHVADDFRRVRIWKNDAFHDLLDVNPARRSVWLYIGAFVKFHELEAMVDIICVVKVDVKHHVC